MALRKSGALSVFLHTQPSMVCIPVFAVLPPLPLLLPEVSRSLDCRWRLPQASGRLGEAPLP
jgi:hypothetical protein